MKDDILNKEEMDLLKEDSLPSINRCLDVIIKSRDTVMDTHKWSVDRRTDDRVLDLYSALCISYEGMVKYKNKFARSQKLESMINNKEDFTSSYLVCTRIIERMLKEYKE